MSIFCFDLDNTICFTSGADYESSIPDTDMIQAINSAYNSGHRIIISTARGSVTGIDYYELTRSQLEKWGLNYHELYVGSKIHADYYIDDKNLSIDEFKNNNYV
jgi:hydroxymethylpyrimidine pyrophosphatase-like HAD family hydrolase